LGSDRTPGKREKKKHGVREKIQVGGEVGGGRQVQKPGKEGKKNGAFYIRESEPKTP